MEELGIDPIYLFSQFLNALLCGIFLLMPVLIVIVVLRRGRLQRTGDNALASPDRGVTTTVKLSKPVKVLVGLATAWMILYPILFLAISLVMFFGIGLEGPGPRELAQHLEPLFFAMIPVHLLTIVLQFSLITFYLVHIIKNTAASDTVRIVLGVGTFFVPFIAMPIYYYLYIWLDKPPPWALA